MRSYGGLRKKIPVTFWTMMAGTLAITGVGIPLTGWIGFAGFVSKDAIIESAWAGNDGGLAFWALVIAALFTSFYSWRVMFMTFYGTPKGDMHAHEHAKESPKVMLIPLVVLSLGAVFAGALWYGAFWGDHGKVSQFFGMPAHHVEATVTGEADSESHSATTQADEGSAHEAAAVHGAPQGAIYFGAENEVMEQAHAAPVWVKLSPFIAMVLGFLTAFWFYILDPAMPRRVAEAQRPLYLFLLNKWYFDEIYDAVFVRGGVGLGRLFWKRGDGTVIDGTIDGVSMGIVPWFTRLNARAQSGYLFTYAFWMVIGIVVFVSWMVISGGAP
jgi:NADH-quinone oxidoreductase subunit L